jgi:hypothetical protein
MEKRGPPPDTRSLNAVTAVCAKARMQPEVERIVARMTMPSGLPPPAGKQQQRQPRRGGVDGGRDGSSGRRGGGVAT